MEGLLSHELHARGLKRAKENLARLEERWDSYSGNIPIKYRAAIETARLEVGLIESHLRADGHFEKQLLENKLNEAFPNAQSKEIVTHKGQKYQRRFWPLHPGHVLTDPSRGQSIDSRK